MERPEEEQNRMASGFIACFVALIVVSLAVFTAYGVQQPLRGPVFVDLGPSPGRVANARSVGVALAVYAAPVAGVLIWAARSAPPWAFRAVLGVGAAGALILLALAV